MIAVEHNVGRLAAIPCGEGRMFRVGETLISVFHLRGGVVRASQAFCPHRGGPLADGLLDNVHVVCPLHNHVFCLDTGEGDGERLTTYEARVEADGTIVVAV
jgi:nitrite reductase/ring-hydroxylating ferredoxin subunit